MLSSIRPGSTVAVVAPAGPVEEAPYRTGLDILAARFRLVHVHHAEACSSPLAYLAGEDAERAEALNRALRDPAVEAIFCARGGYGTTRLLDRLDAEALCRRRPLVVGFSDITALHCWASHLGLATVHGPVVTQLGRLPSTDVEALLALLEGRERPVLRGLTALSPGRASGPLCGGNLTLLAHLCGTRYAPRMEGRLLLIEEVSEAPYRVDRLLTQLRLSGALKQVAGVIVGELLGCDAPQGPHGTMVRAKEVVSDRLGDLGVPVVMGAPVGHGDRNVALPLGCPAHLDADQGTLSFDE